jgi:FSR family fosmidomycin resistance protein-like MFS transporter
MATRSIRTLIDVEHPGLVVLMSLTHGFNEFFSIIVPPLFPFLVPALDISYTAASSLVVVFFLTYSLVQLPVGPLVDVYSTRRLLAGGTVVLAAGIALVAIAPSFPFMLVGMVVAGIGGSTYHPTGMAVISDAESNDTHGRSMGIHGLLGSAGTVAAPLLMVATATAVGWRTALLGGSALGLLFALVLFVSCPRVSSKMAGNSAGVDSLADAVRTVLESTETDGTRDRLRRVMEYLRSPLSLKLGALFVVVGAEVRAIQTFTSPFAVATTGAGGAFGGTMLAVTMVTAGIASMVAGYGVDRVDRVWFALACFLATAAVVAALVVLPLSTLLAPVGFAILGVVLYSVYPAANAIAASASTEGASGSLFAVTNTASAIGGAAGPFLLGVVADATALDVAFLVAAGIALAGVPVVLWARGIAT